MTEGSVVYRSPDKDDHAEMIYSLVAMHFGEGIDRACRNGRIANSHLDWNLSQIALMGDKLVGYWGAYDIQMRIGSARVRTAGINLPVTHPDYRGRGLMPEMISRSMKIAREDGYGLSVINKTHAYFFRFGYVLAWPETNFTVKTEDLPEGSPCLHVEEVNAYDLMSRDDLATIYNRDNETVTGTAVRPTYLRSKHLSRESEPGYLFTDEHHKPAGYLFDGPPKPGQMYCHSDSAGDVEERLRILRTLAERHGHKKVNFHRLPYTSDLAVRLRTLNCEVKVLYRNDGGYVIRVVDLATTLQGILGELSRRLKKSHLARWRGELLVRMEDQEAILAIDRTDVRVTADGTPTRHRVEGDQHIAQLLIGTYAPRETVLASGISLSGDAGDLVEVLFPHQWPQMPNQDL